MSFCRTRVMMTRVIIVHALGASVYAHLYFMCACVSVRACVCARACVCECVRV